MAWTVQILSHERQDATPLEWSHNEHDGFPNHRPYDCLHKRLFRCRSKKTSKLCVTGLCEGNSPVTSEFPAQRASDAENVSIWSSCISCYRCTVCYSQYRGCWWPGDHSSLAISSYGVCWTSSPGIFWVQPHKGCCQTSGPWFNIKMFSYQYRKSHCGDKMVVRSSYLHNGISYTGKTSSLYWIWPVILVSCHYRKHWQTHCGRVTTYGDMDLGQHWLWGDGLVPSSCTVVVEFKNISK